MRTAQNGLTDELTCAYPVIQVMYAVEGVLPCDTMICSGSSPVADFATIRSLSGMLVLQVTNQQVRCDVDL